jgi:CRISPR-associated endonuclease/helicase Cas3
MTFGTFEQLFRAAMSAPGDPAASASRPFPYQVTFATGATLPSVLRAPTGAGKTAAAVLGWLWRRRYHGDLALRHATPRRLVFCLPMRTLVEQTQFVARTWLDRLGLSEDIKVYQLMGGAVEESWEGHPERDAVLVGTQDQLLSRALNRGYAMSRYRWPVHFALLNNDCLWILDEVQLMGPGLSTSVQLQAFRGSLGTVLATGSVWMSATLATGRLRTVDNQDEPLPVLELGPADLDHPVLHRRHHAAKPVRAAKASSDDPAALAREVMDAHHDGSMTLVVMNRVARARDLFAALAKVASAGTAVRLLHSRFRPREREAVQHEVLAEGWSGILVATQAVEAGVDISARTLFTELASWASMVQRFGRCNRRGDFSGDEAQVYWLDVENSEAAPYLPDDLAVARVHLRALTDVGPASLAAIPGVDESPVLPVIRRRDVLELFDTEPDLAGHDLDVSRYIRDGADRDVQVAWRTIGVDGPDPDDPALHRGELCNVPIEGLRKLLKASKGAKLYRWSGLLGEWESIRDPAPGMAVLLGVETGGYNAALGWTGDPKHVPTPLEEVLASAQDTDDREALSYACTTFVTLRDHACDVADEACLLRTALAAEGPWDEVERAARWHDLGKAHEVFAEMICSGLAAADPRRDGGPWAKSDGRPGRRSARPGFRHELASALALLAQGGTDLECYLVAAHHGKVRMALRARPNERRPDDGRRFVHGVWDGDVLPEVDLGNQRSQAVVLDMSPMELGRGPTGPSWFDRMARLMAQTGPFRLAYWESIVRVADWRGTARRRANVVEEVQ